MTHSIHPLAAISDADEAAACILFRTFTGLGKGAWPDLDSARREVAECLESPNLCLGIFDHANDQRLCGWVGLRPMYEHTWELHPLVVDAACQGRGLGRKLMAAVEAAAWQQGIRGILLGTDDETAATSLSQVELGPHNLLDAMRNVRNLKQHPYAFYERCGYTIVGVVPDASGSHKPDIWMWKRLTEPGDPHNESVFP